MNSERRLLATVAFLSALVYDTCKLIFEFKGEK